MKPGTISACLVVFNEEKVIERCLESIASVVDEIIVVHDGECSDSTLIIAKKYTDKIFIKDHIGIAEPHRSFTYNEASSEWIIQIDADEYVETNEHEKIKECTKTETYDGFYFKWELWDGKKPVYFKGLQKLVLFRKNKISFQGLPQKEVEVHGKKTSVDIHLRQRPMSENVSWSNAQKKRRYWLEAHVPYYFPEFVEYRCFAATIDSWIAYTEKVRRHPIFFITWYPVKNLLGQLKNGLWFSVTGWNMAMQQYVYYVSLYYRVWRMSQKLK